jgi:hypothetical protein
VTVEVRGKFRLVTPLLSIVFGGQELDLSSSAVAQIEYLPDPDTATPPPGPMAVITVNDATPDVGETVNFSSDSSTGNPTGFQWDLNGDGMVDSTDPNPSYTYTANDVVNVSLTVVNLTGVSTDFQTITVGTGATPTPGATATPAPTPGCAYPPNVIGKHPTVADANLGAAGFNNVDIFGDLTSGQKFKIQAQNPDHTQCVALTDLFTLHYRDN